MNTPLHRCLALVLLAGLLTGLPAAPGSLERTQARINALLGARLQPKPLPEKPANPFQVTAVAPPAGAPATETLLSGDAEILAYYAPTLKISGLVNLNGQAHFIINQSPYKKGDVILIKGKDKSVLYLKVVNIEPRELTLGYNDAVLVIPVKN